MYNNLVHINVTYYCECLSLCHISHEISILVLLTGLSTPLIGRSFVRLFDVPYTCVRYRYYQVPLLRGRLGENQRQSRV